MLRTPAAFHAGKSLQRVDSGDVLAGIQSEILVARQRRNPAEARAPQKHRHRADGQVQMLGMRNQRKKSQQCQSMQPPVGLARDGFLLKPQAHQKGRHQHENQQRDEARFRRHFPQPDRPHEEPAHEQARNRYRHNHRPHRREA